MEYIDAESHRRHAYVDYAIAAARTLVNHETVGSNLSRDYVDWFNGMADTYFVPDIRHGVIQLTDSQKEIDGHAIVAVETDELLGFGSNFASFSPAQRRNMVRQAYEWGGEDDAEADSFIDHVTNMLRESTDESDRLRSLKQNAALASVVAVRAVTNSTALHKEIVFSGRDVMLLAMPPSGKGLICEEYVVHEGEHQRQADNPISLTSGGFFSRVNDTLMSERDPYQVQADFLAGKEKSGYELRAHDKVVFEAPEMIPHFVADSQSWNINSRDLFDNWMDARVKELLRS